MKSCISCKKEKGFNELCKHGNICRECFAKEIYNTHDELLREEFPELNGLPYREPKNKYAKLLRESATREENK